MSPRQTFTIPRNPGVGPGERRLYIVNQEIGGIHVYDGILSSLDAIVTYNEADTRPHHRGTGDWETELVKMTGKSTGPVYTGVEIHSHGSPGRILLDPVVDLENVEEFGGLLRKLVRPGSLIEVLACEVAAFPTDWLADVEYKPRYVSNLKGYDWQDISKRPTIWVGPHNETERPFTLLEIMRWNQAANRHEAREEEKKHAVERFLGADLDDVLALFRTARKGKLIWRDQMRAPTKPDKSFVPPDVQWRSVFRVGDKLAGTFFKPEENGPAFCTALAKASGCIVRAGWIYQFQERDVGPQKNLIGDWEGWVFDFDADGFKQAYFYLERQQANGSTWNRTAIRPVNGAEGAQFVANRRSGLA